MFLFEWSRKKKEIELVARHFTCSGCFSLVNIQRLILAVIAAKQYLTRLLRIGTHTLTPRETSQNNKTMTFVSFQTLFWLKKLVFKIFKKGFFDLKVFWKSSETSFRVRIKNKKSKIDFKIFPYHLKNRKTTKYATCKEVLWGWLHVLGVCGYPGPVGRSPARFSSPLSKTFRKTHKTQKNTQSHRDTEMERLNTTQVARPNWIMSVMTIQFWIEFLKPIIVPKFLKLTLNFIFSVDLDKYPKN